MKFNVTIILCILLLVFSGLFAVYYKNTQNQLIALAKDKAALGLAVEEQKATIESIYTV